MLSKEREWHVCIKELLWKRSLYNNTISYIAKKSRFVSRGCFLQRYNNCETEITIEKAAEFVGMKLWRLEIAHDEIVLDLLLRCRAVGPKPALFVVSVCWLESLRCGYLSSSAIRLPSDSASRWTSLPVTAAAEPVVDFHHRVIAHIGRTTKKPDSPFRSVELFILQVFVQNRPPRPPRPPMPPCSLDIDALV